MRKLEQWLQAYDACRLLATNLYSFVIHPFTENAHLDFDKMYEVFYIQQRLADDIVDLEIEYVDKIIEKIKNDPEPKEIKAIELNLWTNVRDTASASRRTGCGFTALADMLAALGLKYDSDIALEFTREVMKTKMRAELDCTIDLAILRGTFIGWDNSKEFELTYDNEKPVIIEGANPFYEMLCEEFNEQANRMYDYGRRNVSWSTVAPTGTVSIVAILEKYSNTTGGIEPCFYPFYFRNKKVNPSDKNVRVDFTDQNGDTWQTYPVIMGGFKEWYEQQSNDDPKSVMYQQVYVPLEERSKYALEHLFQHSPYYGSCANDISWEKRIKIQSIIQHYTTNAISSTINLPKDVSRETIGSIYLSAWRAGLKGVTVYREGSRTGVLVTEDKSKNSQFAYHDAPKRPKELKSEMTCVTIKGKKYGVVVGFLDNKPYEVFAFQIDKEWDDFKPKSVGATIKEKSGVYSYLANDEKRITVPDMTAFGHPDEQMLTRLVSGMMRHGINPKFIIEQIDKCPLEVVSFGKALSRVVAKYVPKEDLREKCSECGSKTLVREEGCKKCTSCGHSACG